jgi:type II secretory pathway predicted ATPase ExeA
MYEAFYRLANDPFRLLPDPEICFPHSSCAKAWAYLRYALKRGEGIVVVTGPPGSGKTTLAERLLNGLNPAETLSVRLIANDLGPGDLLRKLAYSFGLPAEGMDRAMLAHRMERYLIELEHRNRRALVLIDEAQTLPHDSLEAMRLLTDIQSRSRPVLQLFLLGQEGLEEVMGAAGMTQFQQRVIASCRLHAMDLAETKAYIEYRLGVAGWQGKPSVSGPAVMAIFRYSRGLPRHVNKICSRLLLHGCTEEKHRLKQRDVLAVVQDLRDELLAPIDDEPEALADITGTDFDSVDQLALVPPPAPVTPQPGPHDGLHAQFVEEEPVPRAAGGRAPVGWTGIGRGPRWRRAGEPYSYRMRHARRFGFRRGVYRLFRIPQRLNGHVRRLAREWGPVLAAFISRTRCRVMQLLSRAGSSLSAWAAGKSMDAGRLRERLKPWPMAALAGLGGLFAVGLALLFWHQGGASQRAVTAVETESLASDRVPYLLAEPAVSVPGVIDGGSARYVDTRVAAADPAGFMGPPLSAVAEAGLQSYAQGTQEEREQRVLRRVTDEAADSLVRTVAKTIAPLDAWPQAVKESETGDGRAVMPIAETAAATGDGTKGLAEATDVAAAALPAENQEAVPEPGTGLAHRAEVEQLLELADQSIEKDWLLLPKATSAYGYLQQVLAVDPGNARALSALDRIVGRYGDMASWSLGKGEFSTARRYIRRGLKVDPGDPRMLALRADLDAAVAEREAASLTQAELGRMAVEVTPSQPIIVPDAESESAFSRFIRYINGEN